MSVLTGAVLAVGDELLLGDIVNGNAAWLGAALAGVGVEVVHSAMVSDAIDRQVVALQRALADADVVIVTGGLGPTSDDRTREALAAVAGVGLTRRPENEQRLRDVFAEYGYPMPDQVLAQADVPDGATALDNPVGTAPGLALTIGGKAVYALPGPPHELEAVARAHVLDDLAARTGVRLVTRTLRCAGVGESQVAERIQALELPTGVDLSFLAGEGIVRVRFTTREDPAVLEPLVTRGRGLLGDHVFGEDDAVLAEVVSAALRARGETVACAESLTGGLLAASLTGFGGASATFRAGLVAYATDTKHSLVGVPQQVLNEHGAVSAETARALAEGSRVRAGTDWGVSTTGVAGPDAQEGQPVGTVHVGVAGPGGARTRSVRWPGGRGRVRALAVTSALDLLRRELAGS